MADTTPLSKRAMPTEVPTMKRLFSDEADLMESVYCIKLCVGKMVGLATDTPKVLADVQVIRGKENIVRELEGKQP
mgnify:CR=1 FL=1